MEEIIRKLSALMPEFSPHLRRAAKRILDHPNEVAVSSMRALAKKANVTPPTMIRLARRVGFENYDSFRAVFQKVVAGRGFQQKAASLQQLGEQGGDAGVAKEMVAAAIDNIAHSFTGLEIDRLSRIADLLIRAPAVYALGAGALHWMCTYLQYLGRAVLPHLRVPRANGNSLVEGIVGIEKGDVALIMSISPYAKQMLDAAKLARVRGATVIAISDSRGSPLAACCDELLIANAESPQFYPSMIGVTLTIETLIALIVSRGDAATLQRIASIDSLRRTEGGYVE